MGADPDRSKGLPTSVRAIPLDLAVLLCFAGVTAVSSFVPVPGGTLVSPFLVTPFVLFAPGYALVSALFPEGNGRPGGKRERSSDEGSVTVGTGIDGVQRGALSVALGVLVVVPIEGLLRLVGWERGIGPLLVSTVVFVVLCTAIAMRRRFRIPVEDRFVVSPPNVADVARKALIEGDTRADVVSNVVLVVVVVVAVTSVAYAIAVPGHGESFTEFYVVPEDGTGNLSTAGDRVDFDVDRGDSLVLGIENREHRRIDYTVVVELHRVAFAGDGSNGSIPRERVVAEDERRRYEVGLAAGETSTLEYNVTPTMSGSDLRLTFLLYRDEPPSDPSATNSYRDTYVWLNGTPP